MNATSEVQPSASDISDEGVGTKTGMWQPIETAPRNGRPVLLWKEPTKEHYVAAFIVGDHPGWCTPDGFEIFRASHWMPLPPPPNSK